jgi:hypothetical protein
MLPSPNDAAQCRSDDELRLLRTNDAVRNYLLVTGVRPPAYLPSRRADARAAVADGTLDVAPGRGAVRRVRAARRDDAQAGRGRVRGGPCAAVAPRLRLRARF